MNPQDQPPQFTGQTGYQPVPVTPNYAVAPVGAYVQPPDYGYQQNPQQPMVQQTVIHVSGSCPTCGRGNLEDEFTCCGVAWAIICFPIGLLCCFLMRKKKCYTCGYQIDA